MAENKRRKKRRTNAKKRSLFGRIKWTRSPIQRPHSTTKGEKGYDRRRRKREDQKETEEGE